MTTTTTPAQRFATREEAEASAKARFHVWTVPADYRAEPSDEPVNYRRVDGRDEHISEAEAEVPS